MSAIRCYLAALLMIGPWTAFTADTIPVGNLTPAKALASFKAEPNLKVELVAAEPVTASPCALAWDEHSRMFVAENRGYPLGGPDGKPIGSIALLEDMDRDGRMDKRTEFATDLTFPNGVLPWRGGLIVTCAPDVLWLKDEDGDGKADIRKVLLTGFATNKSTQLRVNDPTLGPDGWIYLAGGLSGGKITAPDHPERAAVDMERADIRFRPDTGEFELTDGKSQFGLAFDDLGRRFACYNRVQVQHVVLPSRYVARNPHLVSPGVMQDCPELVDNPFLRGTGASRIFPLSANVTTADSHVGFFTAACAVHVFRGDGLPKEYIGRLFSCDPTGNLIHYDRLEPRGATFAARRVRDGVEFLATPDNWFRPVFLADGPDGALYICDMYRKTIEHPEYLPDEVRKRTDFESGKEMGRIWRITGNDAFHRVPGLSAERQKKFRDAVERVLTSELIAALDESNGWHRDTAFRLLLERSDKAIAPLLRTSLRNSTIAAATIAKLRLLEILGGLNEAILADALRSSETSVRENAAPLAEPKLTASTNLLALVLKLADDPDPRVRFHCALALGSAGFPVESDQDLPSRPSVVADVLARIAARDSNDRWTRAAILSSANGHGVALLEALFRVPVENADGISVLLRELGGVLAAAGPPKLAFVDWPAQAAVGFDRKSAFLAGYLDRMSQRGSGEALSPLERLDALRSNAGTGEPLAHLLRQARAFAQDESRPSATRLRAIALLAHANKKDATDTLLPLLATPRSPQFEIDVVRALVQPHNPEVTSDLLAPSRWRGYRPSLREAVLSALLARPMCWPSLLAALESGGLPSSALTSSQREQLKKAKDENVRQRATKLFSSIAAGDRQKAFEEAKACLTLKPVPANGREVFRRLCANCHRFEQEGFAVGPDLFGIRNQPKETILLHIVIPDAEVAPNFTSYTCETKDGRAISGILINDSPNGITIRQALGQDTSIARTDIASLAASSLSLMPQEFEKNITQQEMADLLAFLRGEW